jgi:putative transposase
MRVIAQSPDPLARMHTMTGKKVKSGTIDVKALLAGDEEFLRALVRTALEEVLEAEMTEALSAEKGERTAGRQGYRSGYYGRTLITRVGKLELRVPQDRSGRFSTELFERYQRSERALVAALAEMYVQGVSTRKVKAITEELCGHSFSASSISAMNQRLDASLAQFAGRKLAEAFPYLILDARYERVREAGVITSQAVLIAIGIDWDGRRQSLPSRRRGCSRSSSPIARADRAGATSCLGSRHAVCTASNLSSPTIMPGSERRCARFWRRPLTSAAMSIFSETRSTMCPVKSMTTACRSCAGCMTGATSPRRAAIWPPGSPSGQANTPSSPAGSKRTSMRR